MKSVGKTSLFFETNLKINDQIKYFSQYFKTLLKLKKKC